MKSLRRVWAAAQRIPFAQHIKIGNQEAERYLILTRLLKTDEAMQLAPSGIASLPDYFQYKGYAGLPSRPAWGYYPQTPSSLRGGFKNQRIASATISGLMAL